MTDPKNSPVDDPNKPDDSKLPVVPKPDDNNVAYETHRKLLSEKKVLQEKFKDQETELQKYREEKSALEEQRLKDSGDYEALKTLAEERAKTAEKKLAGIEDSLLDARKLNAIIDGVQGTISKKFFSFIDIGSVIMNPETGELDSTSVTKAVEAFQTNYPELIQTKGNNFPAPNAPDSSKKVGSVSYEEFAKMDKLERKKNLHLVDLPEEAKFLI